MKIALIAHDSKKELMAAFCIAYKAILSRHSLYATGNTASVVWKTTGLDIYEFSPGEIGGEEQISARIAYNEIDMLVYFRGLIGSEDGKSETENIFRLCDANNIPFATNIATAEILVKGLERGDLAWRDLVR